MIRVVVVLGLVWLCGCAPVERIPMVSEAPPAAPGTRPAGQQQAAFDTFPDALLEAAFAACDSPGQTALRPSPASVRCETLPTPDAAAALILRFDGTVDALPRFIVTFDAAEDGEFYLVTADSFVTVPQFDGTIRDVRITDDRMLDDLSRFLEAAGGTIVAP
jgi:hypothetical protein